MIEEFKIEESDPAPEKACYLVHSWNGKDWYLCWRADPAVPWLALTVEKSAEDALHYMRKHAAARDTKPWYYDVNGDNLG